MNLRSAPFRYYRSYVYEHVRDIRGFTRLKHILWKIGRIGMETYHGEPEGVFEKDWDNLIILDACRHDIYEEVTGKKVEKRVTLGSTSREYMEENYAEGDFSDVVYVSANGFLTDEMMEKFAGRSGIFHEKYETVRTDWDEDFGHVLPEAVVRDGNSARKLFPEKRKIFHFMQPHAPFHDFDFGDTKSSFFESIGAENAYFKAERGKISRDKIIEGYKHNLEFVLDEIGKFIENLEGKTVITADHGEILGENGLYGHPLGSDAKVLREVPWDVVKVRDEE